MRVGTPESSGPDGSFLFYYANQTFSNRTSGCSSGGATEEGVVQIGAYALCGGVLAAAAFVTFRIVVRQDYNAKGQLTLVP